MQSGKWTDTEKLLDYYSTTSPTVTSKKSRQENEEKFRVKEVNQMYLDNMIAINEYVNYHDQRYY